MSIELDRKYRGLAVSALHVGLCGYEYHSDCLSVPCEKKEIREAFDYSVNILRSGRVDDRLRARADSVFEICTRLVRCLFFPEEARVLVLQGEKHHLNEISQLELLRRNMLELKEFQQKA